MVQGDGADGPPPGSAIVETETVKNDCEKHHPGDSDLPKPADMEIVKSKKEKEKAKENLTKLGAIVENEGEEMPSGGRQQQVPSGDGQVKIEERRIQIVGHFGYDNKYDERREISESRHQPKNTGFYSCDCSGR